MVMAKLAPTSFLCQPWLKQVQNSSVTYIVLVEDTAHRLEWAVGLVVSVVVTSVGVPQQMLPHSLVGELRVVGQHIGCTACKVEYGCAVNSGCSSICVARRCHIESWLV